MTAAPNIHWTRYVPHADRDAYLALGWQCRGPVVGHHGIYSVLMIWRGSGQPPEPGKEPGQEPHKPKPRQPLPWVRLCALLGGVIGGLIGWGLVR